jgi:hypothetical protein
MSDKPPSSRELGKFFFELSIIELLRKVKNSKKKFKFFFMLLPTFGTLANPHL